MSEDTESGWDLVQWALATIVVVAILFANFHLTTDYPDHKYGPRCHYNQIGDWLGTITVTVNCKNGAP